MSQVTVRPYVAVSAAELIKASAVENHVRDHYQVLTQRKQRIHCGW